MESRQSQGGFYVSEKYKTCHWSPAQELKSTSYANNAKIVHGITLNLEETFPIPIKNKNQTTNKETEGKVTTTPNNTIRESVRKVIYILKKESFKQSYIFLLRKTPIPPPHKFCNWLHSQVKRHVNAEARNTDLWSA